MANSNQDLMKRGGQAIDDMAERTGQSSGLYGQGMDAAADATRAASETARSVARAASGAYENATDAAGRAYDSAAGMARDTGYAVQRGAADFEQTLAEQTSRHPLVTLGLAMGIGFVMGAWFAGASSWRSDSRS